MTIYKLQKKSSSPRATKNGNLIILWCPINQCLIKLPVIIYIHFSTESKFSLQKISNSPWCKMDVKQLSIIGDLLFSIKNTFANEEQSTPRFCENEPSKSPARSRGMTSRPETERHRNRKNSTMTSPTPRDAGGHAHRKLFAQGAAPERLWAAAEDAAVGHRRRLQYYFRFRLGVGRDWGVFWTEAVVFR